MRSLALMLLLSTASAAVPALAPHSEGGVSFSSPAEWKPLVKPTEHSAVLSRDATTHLHLHWWPFKADASPDKMVDKLIAITQANLPMGQIVERSRSSVLDGRGRLVSAEFNKFGYVMNLGFIVVMDEPGGAIKGGILLAPPPVWTDLDGPALLAQVTDSLKVPR